MNAREQAAAPGFAEHAELGNHVHPGKAPGLSSNRFFSILDRRFGRPAQDFDTARIDVDAQIGRLARPKSFEFEPVTISNNPDFNNKSLRSNVVFRWEYRRGSTLYLVYNVSNSEQSRPGEFSAFRDLGSGFRAAGTQVLMVKFNYWLGL